MQREGLKLAHLRILLAPSTNRGIDGDGLLDNNQVRGGLLPPSIMIPISIELNEGVVDLIKRIADELIPKAWKNIEAKFSISEVDLHFLCDSKSSNQLRVWVFDGKGEEVTYVEGDNSRTASVRIGSNR